MERAEVRREDMAERLAQLAEGDISGSSLEEEGNGRRPALVGTLGKRGALGSRGVRQFVFSGRWKQEWFGLGVIVRSDGGRVSFRGTSL